MTAFQARVYEAVRRIPAGKVASYAAVASAIGCRSARVVGQALRLCPFDDVPCHRVVASGGRLGGYGGRTAGLEIGRKKRRLLAEGVRFDGNDLIEPDCVLADSPKLRWLLSEKSSGIVLQAPAPARGRRFRASGPRSRRGGKDKD